MRQQAPEGLKGLHHVLGPIDGDSPWQPEPANGDIRVKVSPHDLSTHGLAAAFQVIDPGCYILPHEHERAEGLLFIWEEHGIAVVDGVERPIEPGSLVHVGKWATHRIVNGATTQMKVLWAITPPGLEDFLTTNGPRRGAGDQCPEGLRRPDNIDELLDCACFARS
jgi:hypothetical protein